MNRLDPEKLAKIQGLLVPSKKTKKKGPKGQGTKGRGPTPEEMAWRSWELRRSNLLGRYGLPGPTDS